MRPMCTSEVRDNNVNLYNICYAYFLLQSKIIKWRLYELHYYFPIYLHSHKPLQLVLCLTLRKVRNIVTNMVNTIFSSYRGQIQSRLSTFS